MKKTWIWALLLALIFAASARAESQTPMADTMFINAKEAVSLISYGEFDKALNKLAFTDPAINAKALKKYITTNCREIYDISVQCAVSVAWYDGMTWALAVPFEAPDDAAVGALVFYSKDGINFDTLAFTRWGLVVEGYEASEDVYWNEEYTPGFIVVGDW